VKTKIMLVALIVLILATVWVVYAAEQARTQQQTVSLMKAMFY
jgi:hypothetical protein